MYAAVARLVQPQLESLARGRRLVMPDGTKFSYAALLAMWFGDGPALAAFLAANFPCHKSCCYWSVFFLF
jgi:hypothetical protein